MTLAICTRHYIAIILYAVNIYLLIFPSYMGFFIYWFIVFVYMHYITIVQCALNVYLLIFSSYLGFVFCPPSDWMLNCDCIVLCDLLFVLFNIKFNFVFSWHYCLGFQIRESVFGLYDTMLCHFLHYQVWALGNCISLFLRRHLYDCYD